MKVRYIGESDPLQLLNGKEYDVLSVEYGWLRVVDETEDDYLYPFEGNFELCAGQMKPLLPSLSENQMAFILEETGMDMHIADDSQLDKAYSSLVKIIVEGTEEEEDDLSERTKMALSIVEVPTEYGDDAAA